MTTTKEKAAAPHHRLLTYILGAILCNVTPVAAGDPQFPTRTLTLVVAFPPGGPPDQVARIMAPPLGELLGKPVIIENRPGASGSIAAQSVARAEPDGHAMLTADLTFLLSPHVVPNVTYNTLKDFKFVVLSARTGQTMVVNPKSDFKTAGDVIATARKSPETIRTAHTGIGSPPHLGLMAFLNSTGTSVLQVPYKGGAQALQDVVGGHVDMVFVSPGTSVPLAQQGLVRILGTTGDRRLADFPEVPTYKESGIDMGGMTDGQYFGIAVPAATPAAVVSKLNAAANEALKRPAIKEQFEKIFFETVGGSSESFEKFARAQSAYWKAAMAGIDVRSK